MSPIKEYHINNSVVKIIFGDILDSEADVIVNCSGSKMTMSGGLTRAILEAGGEEIRNDAQTKLPVKVGDAVVTTAGKLRQKYVFHCITIDKSGDQSNTPEGVSEEDIQHYIVAHSIDKCFQLLHAMELTSIAFPAIGAGQAGFPLDKVAKVMSETIGRNLRKTHKSFSIEIYLFGQFETIRQWDYLPMFELFAAQEALAGLLKEQTLDRLSREGIATPHPAGTLCAKASDVFISYSRKDAEIVKPIYGQLEKAGIKCWLDVDGMYSGVSFKKVIVDAIKQSKVLLFMSSEHSNKSRNVVSEVSVAVEYEKSIIPVRLDMSPYADSIEYDIINHDYVIYEPHHEDVFLGNLIKRIVSTLKMH